MLAVLCRSSILIEPNSLEVIFFHSARLSLALIGSLKQCLKLDMLFNVTDVFLALLVMRDQVRAKIIFAKESKHS